MATVDSRAIRRPARPTGALLVGDPETVAEKILQVNEALGGISRLTFQMSVAALPHAKMLRAIELLGTEVAPMVRKSPPLTVPAGDADKGSSRRLGAINPKRSIYNE